MAPHNLGGKLSCGSGLTKVFSGVDTPVTPLVGAVRVHALEQDAVVVAAALNIFAQASLLILRFAIDLHRATRYSGGGRGRV